MIRLATPYDVEACRTMLREYAQETQLRTLIEMQDPQHVTALLERMILGAGFVLIDNQARGMLCALIHGNVWNPAVRTLSELAFYVTPQHRGRTLGGRLWLEFNRRAQDLLQCERVALVSCSRQQNLDVERYGYRQMHVTLMREACQPNIS